MKKTLLVLALVAAVAGCKRKETPVATATETTATAQARGSEPPPAQTTTGTDIGAMMPEYSAVNLDGSKFDLATKRGKVALLNIWATWCGPCRYEIPELESMHAKLAPRGFEVIGVSVDESGVDAVKQFVAEQKMTYPVVLDAEGRLAGIFQSSVLPTSILVDRTGKIVWKHYGAILPNDTELAQAIERAL